MKKELYNVLHSIFDPIKKGNDDFYKELDDYALENTEHNLDSLILEYTKEERSGDKDFLWGLKELKRDFDSDGCSISMLDDIYDIIDLMEECL